MPPYGWNGAEAPATVTRAVLQRFHHFDRVWEDPMNVNKDNDGPAEVSYWWEWLAAPDREAETMFATLLAKYQADRGVVVPEVVAMEAPADETSEVVEEPVPLVGAKSQLGWTGMAPFEYSWDGLRLDYA